MPVEKTPTFNRIAGNEVRRVFKFNKINGGILLDGNDKRISDSSDFVQYKKQAVISKVIRNKNEKRYT